MIFQIGSKSIEDDFIQIPTRNFRVVLCRIRLFPTLISKVKWLGSGLTLNKSPINRLTPPNFFKFSIFFDCTRLQNLFQRPKEELRELLFKAAGNHVKLYQAAMTGKGVDRHLFTLYVVSRYLGLESKFLDKALTQQWKLSTSQVTASKSDLQD